MSSEQGRKTKIIRIIARLNIGGPAVHTILLTKELNGQEFDSILVAGSIGRGEKDMSHFAQSKGVKPVIISKLQRRINLLYDAISFWKVLCLIKREQPDIIHTHTAKAGALGRFAGLIYKIFLGGKNCKIVHTFHGTVLSGYFGRIRSGVFLLIERMLARASDRIIVVSEGVKEELLALKLTRADKITVIPLGLDMGDLLRIGNRHQETGFRIGIIGRLVPVKNHKMFLGAVKKIIDGNGGSASANRFLIVGDGELRGILENLVLKLGVGKFVEFCGWNSDVSKIYKDLDIVVLTSLKEGTPLSLIEAMSAARPVIATEVGGVSELFIKTIDYGFATSQRIKIYDNGILCNSGDIDGLSEGLNLLLKNHRLRELMGGAGRNFVRNRFSKERLAKDIKLLYNTLLKKE